MKFTLLSSFGIRYSLFEILQFAFEFLLKVAKEPLSKILSPLTL